MSIVAQAKGSRRQGSIKEISPGKWVIRLSLAEVGTQRIRLSKTLVGTKADAQRWLNAQVRRREDGVRTAPDQQRLGAWTTEWTDAYCTQHSPRTRADSRAIFRRELTKELAARKLSELSATDVQRWVNGMTAKGLAPRTVRLAHSTLRSCLTRAVKLGKINRNVARDVDLPRERHVERVVLGPDEARRFLDAARGDQWEALFTLMLHAGLRPGEALGLTWADLDGATLRVRRALVRVVGEAPVLSSTKTGVSRAIPLGDEVLDALRRHRLVQIERRLLLGATYEDRNLIFPNELGGFASAGNILTRSFKPLLTRAVLPDMRLYDLRHSCATLLLAAGEHPKVVQERLGHSNIALTLDTYSHVLPGLQARASEKLETLLRAPAPATQLGR